MKSLEQIEDEIDVLEEVITHIECANTECAIEILNDLIYELELKKEQIYIQAN